MEKGEELEILPLHQKSFFLVEGNVQDLPMTVNAT